VEFFLVLSCNVEFFLVLSCNTNAAKAMLGSFAGLRKHSASRRFSMLGIPPEGGRTDRAVKEIAHAQGKINPPDTRDWRANEMAGYKCG
jgi:hypothetical protein